MNKLLRCLFLTAGLGLLAIGAKAETPFHPAVVDLNKVLDGHYKSEGMKAQMDDIIKKVQEQLDQATKQIQEKGTKYQELYEKSQDSLLKPEARAQAEVDAQKLMEELQKMQGEVQNFRTRSQEQINRRVRTFQEGLLDEITQVVQKMAAARSITMVFDKSASPVTGVSSVVFSDPSYDLTEDVLKEVNKNRPPPAPTPAPVAPAPAAVEPAPAAVPAAK